MRKLRYLFRLIWAFLTQFKVLIIIGIVLGLALFLLINYIFPRIAARNTVRISLAGRFTVDSLPEEITQMIGSGLTKIDETGAVVPDLAESWSSEDKGKTWVFKLRNNLVWQDGKEVLSKNINYQFSDAKISFPDNKTLIFTLENPYSAFPSVVTRPVFKNGLLGTDEWEVKDLSLVSDFVDKITLENRSGSRIIYKFYPTEENAKLAFELGEVDSVTKLLDPSPLETWKKAKISRKIDRGEYVALFFNTEQKSGNLLSDKSLRQALSYATQKDTLGGKRAISPIPDTNWAYNSQVKQYSFDQARAKTLIAALPNDVKNNLNFTITTPPILLKQAESIKKDWEAVGLKVDIQVMSNIPSNYQALLAIFDAPDDPDQYSIWHSTQTQTNISHYSNPRVDKLLEDGRTTVDINVRKQIYLDFQRFLLEDAPAIFLYYPTTYTISR